MLVEFSVANFRSISERVTFSAVASAAASKVPNRTVETGNSLAPNLLTTAVLLGPNASGKSSLIDALKFMRSMVIGSAKDRTHGEMIKFSNNKIIDDYRDKPTEVEVIFDHEGEVFQYGFLLDHTRILEEWLYARTSKKNSKTRDIFHREYNAEKEAYHWTINEGQLPGERESWKAATRENALFLSTAVQLNSSTLRNPFTWIREFLDVIGANQRIDPEFTAKLIQDRDHRVKILDFMEALDLKISDFRIESKPAHIPDDAREFFSESMLEKLSEEIKDQKVYDVFTCHKNGDGAQVELSLQEESDGTQAIFGLAGPIFDVLENGYTLFVDELSNSLHPLALKGLVAIFQDPLQNSKGAQLFFTSHETSIISKGFMHKDQIWFIDRPDGFSTELRPMSDYNVREVEAFQRSYLGGKFGALPNIRRLRNVS